MGSIIKKIPVNTPLLNGNERNYLNECIDTGWISSEGPFVEKFENSFSNYVGRSYGISVSNGSVAIDIALAAIGIEPGDEVILPTFTIISCVASIVRAGAIPVLVDSDPITWNMNSVEIEAKISSRTKVIMVVHIYGLPVDMEPILLLAKKYKLRIIEDAAEMHGQTYKGKKCGSFGEISTFSFYPNKHITTGEGGMVLTDDKLIADRCRSLRNLCFKPEKRFVHDELGWNYRMSNLQAAIGLAQLERLEFFIRLKRDMGALYSNLLEGIESIQLPLARTDYAENIYWVFGVVLSNKLPLNAEDVMNQLSKKGIGTRPFFYPMHKQPVFQKMNLFQGERYPVAESLAEKGFYLPSGLALSVEDIAAAASSLKEVLKCG